MTYLAQHLPEMLPFPFSGVIAIQVGDEPIIQACHCPQQPEFTVDQSLNVLSIGKLFTATAVLQLIEDGKLSLKTPLSELLTADEMNVPLQPPYLERMPDSEALNNFKRHASMVTVEHLLSHTAGFVDRPASESDGITEGESWSPHHIGKYSYSNYGYQLLARIIGKHSDCGNVKDHEAGFRSHIENRIFKPAGMDSAIREMHSSSKSIPPCFEISKDGQRRQVKERQPYPHGNGCWHMTASDLLAFKSAFHSPNVLLKEASLKTIKEHESGHLGLLIDRDKESRAITGFGHPGGGPGMSSFLHTWCTKNPPITVAVLSNYSGCEMVKPWLDPLMKRD